MRHLPEPYVCPITGCKAWYMTLNGLFQHMEKTDEAGHNPRGRWLIVDRNEHRLYITDTPLGKLSLEKLRAEAAPGQPTSKVEEPVSA